MSDLPSTHLVPSVRNVRMPIRVSLLIVILSIPSMSCSGDDVVLGRVLSGKITTKAGYPVYNVKIEFDDVRGFTDINGKYVIDNPPEGDQLMTISHPWCGKPQEREVPIFRSGETSFNTTINPLPFKLTAHDKAISDTYAKTFDWRKSDLKISIIDSPTTRELHNAIFWNNPAYYRDTSAEQKLDSKLSVLDVSGVFIGKHEPFVGVDVLDNTTVHNSIAETPLTPKQIEQFMLFSPMFGYLSTWDTATDEIAGLGELRSVIEGKLWGKSAALRPQHIGRVYIDGDDLWVEIVFEPFVVTTDISDSDNDGFQEIYARVNSKLVPHTMIQGLRANYCSKVHGYLEMAKVLDETITMLYSTSVVTIDSYIGTPYRLPSNLGMVEYPWVVLSHRGLHSAKQVLLLGD